MFPFPEPSLVCVCVCVCILVHWNGEFISVCWFAVHILHCRLLIKKEPNRLACFFTSGHERNTTDWKGERASRLVHSLHCRSTEKLQKLPFARTSQSIATLIVRRKEEPRKEVATFSSQSVGMICVQPNQHSQCSESVLGETCER